MARQWGALPGWAGVSLIAGGAVLGAVVTVAAGGEPGTLLGLFLVAGTLAASLAVQPRAVYVLIPAPALAYLVAAAAAGLAHGRAADTSHTAMAVSAAQWIAGGFLTMMAATIVAIAVTAGRWYWRIREGLSPARPDRPAAGAAEYALDLGRQGERGYRDRDYQDGYLGRDDGDPDGDYGDWYRGRSDRDRPGRYRDRGERDERGGYEGLYRARGGSRGGRDGDHQERGRSRDGGVDGDYREPYRERGRSRGGPDEDYQDLYRSRGRSRGGQDGDEGYGDRYRERGRSRGGRDEDADYGTLYRSRGGRDGDYQEPYRDRGRGRDDRVPDYEELYRGGVPSAGSA